MSKEEHKTATASHYDEQAEYYDLLNENNSAVLNNTVETILKRHGVKTVLDITCGTGSQLFWLAKRGYEVVGADISARMLDVARKKAIAQKRDIRFIEGDMRTLQVGVFDAVISMFNAIGHLTKDDFERALQAIRKNLKDNGLYIFDINNLDYLLNGDNITRLTIDWKKQFDDTNVRKIQYSTITHDGVLTSYTTSYVQKDNHEPIVSHEKQTLQVYAAQQLRELLQKNGFMVVEQSALDGSTCIRDKTDCIVTVAVKQ